VVCGGCGHHHKLPGQAKTRPASWKGGCGGALDSATPVDRRSASGDTCRMMQTRIFVRTASPEDLTNDLSRIPGSFVIARTTEGLHLQGKSVDVKQIGRDHRRSLTCSKAAYGGLTDRVAGSTVQLIDTKTGSHVWADHFDTDQSRSGAGTDENHRAGSRGRSAPNCCRDVGRRGCAGPSGQSRCTGPSLSRPRG